MAGDGSAYAALGLPLGADPAAIERAYKSLIKRYHPDREGGDPKRAAEITQAYRELRGPAAKDALELNDFEMAAGKPSLGWIGVAIAAAGAIAILLVVAGPASRLTAVPSMRQARAPARSARRCG